MECVMRESLLGAFSRGDVAAIDNHPQNVGVIEEVSSNSFYMDPFIPCVMKAKLDRDGFATRLNYIGNPTFCQYAILGMDEARKILPVCRGRQVAENPFH